MTTKEMERIAGDLTNRVIADATRRGLDHADAAAYADALSTYLALAVGKCVEYCSTLATWNSANAGPRGSFPRHAMAMTWDSAEVNPLVLFPRFIDAIATVIERLPANGRVGHVRRAAAHEVGVAFDELCAELDRGLSIERSDSGHPAAPLRPSGQARRGAGE